MRTAIISALNDAVPEKYYTAGGNAGQNVCTATDNPRQIIEYLTNRHGKLKQAEKEAANNKWREPYNPLNPIEIMFKKLEEFWVQALIAGPPYTETENKLVDRALDNIKQAGLYTTAVNK